MAKPKFSTFPDKNSKNKNTPLDEDAIDLARHLLEGGIDLYNAEGKKLTKKDVSSAYKIRKNQSEKAQKLVKKWKRDGIDLSKLWPTSFPANLRKMLELDNSSFNELILVPKKSYPGEDEDYTQFLRFTIIEDDEEDGDISVTVDSMGEDSGSGGLGDHLGNFDLKNIDEAMKVITKALGKEGYF